MVDPGAPVDPTTAILLQLIPLAVLSWPLAWLTGVVAKKRGLKTNWLWVVLVLIPFFGPIVFFTVFQVLSVFSVLDRLNRLEGKT